MVRMMPLLVVLSVLLAATVCLVAWMAAGRPTRTQARHGIEPGRPTDGPDVDLARTLDGSAFDDLDPVDDRFDPLDGRFDDQLPDGPPTGSWSVPVGPEDDPEFIRQLARVVAERGERQREDGELPPD